MSQDNRPTGRGAGTLEQVDLDQALGGLLSWMVTSEKIRQQIPVEMMPEALKAGV